MISPQSKQPSDLDLFANQPKPETTRDAGRANGKFLGHLALGKTRKELLAMHGRGEFDGLNLDYAKQWLKMGNVA